MASIALRCSQYIANLLTKSRECKIVLQATDLQALDFTLNMHDI